MAEDTNFPPKAVVDASVALAFLLPDEKKTTVDSLFQSFVENKVKILVPEIFYFEVFNGLRSAVIKKRIKAKLAEKLLRNFLSIQLKIKKIDWLANFQLALKENISFYNAAYLSLSRKEKTPVLTLDKLMSKSGRN